MGWFMAMVVGGTLEGKVLRGRASALRAAPSALKSRWDGRLSFRAEGEKS